MADSGIYLDNNATTGLAPEVLNAMLPYLREAFGNPSSLHSFGRPVKEAILEARDTVAAFLLRHPQHRHIARRAQIAARLSYAEIRDNTISAALLPIDLLRCKLAFFGATHFDPRSDRWVRINMFRDAPFPHELAGGEADDWSYPPLAEVKR